VRARIAGHPLHPALAHFPLALWLAAVLWDAVGWWRAEPLWEQMSYWCLALGLAAALPTAATGFVELLSLRSDEPALGTATAHMLIMLTATGLFGASWLVRASGGAPAWAFALAAVGAAVVLVGGWLGGTLVYRYGLGR
jgi:uncharacterized membrane protein